jgi:hypothetical protein
MIKARIGTTSVTARRATEACMLRDTTSVPPAHVISARITGCWRAEPKLAPSVREPSSRDVASLH